MAQLPLAQHSAAAVRERLETLRHEHQVLDSQLRKLTSQGYLTPSEQMEAKRIKKLKLQKKDQIQELGLKPR